MSTRTVPPPDQTSPRVRVLLVDDMPQVLRDLRQLLELTGLVEVVGEAGDGLEAVRLAGGLTPEAVVMDLEMPGMDGYEATRRIKACPPSPRVIVLSVHAGPEERQRARVAGADAFVVKGAHYEVLVDAILARKASPDSFNSGK
jgi:DNA-binding NarL/FixJ family response regulator